MPNPIEVLLPILLYTFTLLLGGALAILAIHKIWRLVCWTATTIDEYAKDVSRHNRRKAMCGFMSTADMKRLSTGAKFVYNQSKSTQDKLRQARFQNELVRMRQEAMVVYGD